jgi:hypothetical protein
MPPPEQPLTKAAMTEVVDQLLDSQRLLSASDRTFLQLVYRHGVSRRAVAEWMGISESGMFKRLKKLTGRARRLAASGFFHRRRRLTPADRRLAELYFVRGLSLRRLSQHPSSGGLSAATLSRRIRKIEAKLFNRPTNCLSRQTDKGR